MKVQGAERGGGEAESLLLSLSSTARKILGVNRKEVISNSGPLAGEKEEEVMEIVKEKEKVMEKVKVKVMHLSGDLLLPAFGLQAVDLLLQPLHRRMQKLTKRK